MSSSDIGSEDEQLADQHVTGANADPQVLQYFWDLASLETVRCSDCLDCAVYMVRNCLESPILYISCVKYI